MKNRRDRLGIRKEKKQRREKMGFNAIERSEERELRGEKIDIVRVCQFGGCLVITSEVVTEWQCCDICVSWG